MTLTPFLLAAAPRRMRRREVDPRAGGKQHPCGAQEDAAPVAREVLRHFDS